MKGLTQINKITINSIHILKAFDFLKYAGQKGVEAVSLFAGVENNNVFHIREVIIPKQSSYIMEQGLMYAVENDELYRINLWLYENKMSLIAQIHSHPTEAYHSSTDDRYPIVDTYGGVSIVVPYFAQGKMSIYDWAIYRLSLSKAWLRLNDSEVNSLFQIY